MVALGAVPAGAQTVTVGGGFVNYDATYFSKGEAGPWAEFGWGQTFRTPSTVATRLDRWSFWSGAYDSDAFSRISFRLQIFEWSGGLVGPSLYTSPVFSPGLSRPQEAAFTPGVTLNASKAYIALLNPEAVIPGSAGLDWGRAAFYRTCNSCPDPSGYSSGSLVEVLSTTDVATPSRYISFGTYDADFLATFSSPIAVVPEPASLMLVGTGVFCVGLSRFVRRKRRS